MTFEEIAKYVHDEGLKLEIDVSEHRYSGFVYAGSRPSKWAGELLFETDSKRSIKGVLDNLSRWCENRKQNDWRQPVAGKETNNAKP